MLAKEIKRIATKLLFSKKNLPVLVLKWRVSTVVVQQAEEASRPFSTPMFGCRSACDYVKRYVVSFTVDVRYCSFLSRTLAAHEIKNKLAPLSLLS